MKLPISTGVLHDELVSAVNLINEWVHDLGEGIPGVDRPAEDQELLDWLRNFRGELLYVSDKCASLAARVSDIE